MSNPHAKTTTPRKCIVTGCTVDQRSRLITFHEFPLEFVAFQRWITAIKDNNNQIIVSSDRASLRICCEHFYPTDIIMQCGKMAIRPTAVPKLFPLSRLRAVSTTQATSKICSETSNTKPVPVVKSPLADSSLRNSSKPIKQIKPAPIQQSKVVSPKTATSSNTTANPMKYTAVWDENEKKFKVTRIDKADELVTTFSKSENTTSFDPLNINHEEEFESEPESEESMEVGECNDTPSINVYPKPSIPVLQIQAKRVAKSSDINNRGLKTFRYCGDVPNEVDERQLDHAVKLFQTKISYKRQIITQYKKSNDAQKLQIAELKKQTREIQAKLRENEKQTTLLAKPVRVEVSNLVGVQSLPCPEVDCGQIFTNNGHLQLHLTKHHRITREIKSDRILSFHCPVDGCKYSEKGKQFFLNRKALRQHYVKVHAAKVEACKQCNMTFPSVALLKLHERCCGHEFKCIECGFKYGSREALQTHCRRKGHKMPEPLRKKQIQIIQTQPVAVMPAPSSYAPKKIVKIAPKPIIIEEVIVNFQLPAIDDRKKLLQTSQTQTKLFLDKWNKRVGLPATICTSATHTEPNSFQDLDFFDTETTTQMIASSSSQTDRTLNTHNFIEGDSLGYFGADDHFASGFCDIETQTELLPNTVDHLDQLLYSNMHTQTCDEIMSDFGWTDIQTQTNFPLPVDYNNDILVSTETQTSFTTKPSMYTQTLDEVLNDDFSNSNFSTRYTQTMLDKCM